MTEFDSEAEEAARERKRAAEQHEEAAREHERAAEEREKAARDLEEAAEEEPAAQPDFYSGGGTLSGDDDEPPLPSE